jgi:hypothetical protein
MRDYEVLGLQVAVATILEFFLFTCFEAPVDAWVVVVCRSLTPAN